MRFGDLGVAATEGTWHKGLQALDSQLWSQEKGIHSCEIDTCCQDFGLQGEILIAK